MKSLSHVQLFATPWTVDHQAPLSMEFSRQEYWSGLPFPSPMHESEKWKWSCVWLLATPWIAAHQAPLSMEFYRQEYWSGVPLPSYIVTAAAAAKSLQSCLTLWPHDSVTGNGNLLQYSYLENSMDRGAWWATVHGVAKSQTELSDFHSQGILMCCKVWESMSRSVPTSVS